MIHFYCGRRATAPRWGGGVADDPLLLWTTRHRPSDGWGVACHPHFEDGTMGARKWMAAGHGSTRARMGARNGRPLCTDGRRAWMPGGTAPGTPPKAAQNELDGRPRLTAAPYTLWIWNKLVVPGRPEGSPAVIPTRAPGLTQPSSTTRLAASAISISVTSCRRIDPASTPPIRPHRLLARRQRVDRNLGAVRGDQPRRASRQCGHDQGGEVQVACGGAGAVG